jgi:hypothetical protein
MPISESKTRTYYGEYTLKHWIDLLLSGNIVLPEYQRSFAWDEGDVKKLISALSRGAFVPPITIAHDSGINTILDGQQRLTSLLLACLNRYPIKEAFPLVRQAPALEEEDNSTPGGNEQDIPLKWTFHKLIPKSSDPLSKVTLIELRERISSDHEHYKELYGATEFSLSSDGSLPEFYFSHYIGFTYIIYEENPPVAGSHSPQVMTAGRYFAELFRSINYTGKGLSAEESRRALYFRNPEFTPFFDAKLTADRNDDVLSDLKVKINGETCNIDWIRYLAILTAYQVNPSSPLRGYSSLASREDFFTDYVSWVVGLDQDRNPDKFGNQANPNRELFEGDPPHWRERYVWLKEDIEIVARSIDGKRFSSLVDADYWLFGLVNLILFQGKRLDRSQWSTLKENIEAAIAEAKTPVQGTGEDGVTGQVTTPHLKGLNQLRYTYYRLHRSIQCYDECVSLEDR